MAGSHFRSHHDHVWVSLFGTNVTLRRDTIKHRLPRLYENARPEMSMGYLRPDRYTDTDHWSDREALEIVFDYLKELEIGQGVSAVLRTRLDSEWRNSSHSKTEAKALFYSLCKVFSHFGCSSEMFHTMESFFERHAAEIVQRPPHGWLKYIQGLDRIRTHNKTGMTSALSSLLQYDRRLDSRDLHYLARDRALSLQTLDTLFALLEERKRRRAGSPLQVPPLDPPRDLIRHHGGPKKISGANIDPDVLLDIAEFEPEKLDFHPYRRPRRGLYDDDDDQYPLYSHKAPDCSNCDPTSEFHPATSRSRPRMLPPIDDASFDLFNEEFGRRLRIPGVPVM